MSGFSVGDFITIAEKAWQLYDRCKSASERYQKLAERVQSLHYVLKEVCDFAEDNDVPQDNRKVHSLVVARESCDTVLDELQDFLDKHIGMNSEKSWLDVLKFISSDIAEYEVRLEHCTGLLKLSLLSLSNLAIRKVQNTLDEIFQNYRADSRADTIVAEALIDKKSIPAEQLFDQVATDLEEKGIHPDSILFNQRTISTRISRELSNTRRPSAQHLDEPRDTTSRRSASHSPSHSQNRTEPRVANGSLLPGSMYSMLSPVSHTASAKRLQRGRDRLVFIKIFRQRDQARSGYLTHDQCIQICTELCQYSGIQKNDLQLNSFVEKYTMNDFKINDIKFVDMMFEFVETVKNNSLLDSLENLLKYAKTARMARRDNYYQLAQQKRVCPWGYVLATATGRQVWMDLVRGGSSQPPADYILAENSFSLMSIEAESCIEILDDFEQRWLPTFAAPDRPQTVDAIKIARLFAQEYAELRKPNRSDGQRLAVLDIVTSCHKVVSAVNMVDRLPISPDCFTRLQEVQFLMSTQLQKLRGFCQFILVLDGKLSQQNPELGHDLDLTSTRKQLERFAYLISQQQFIWLELESVNLVFEPRALQRLENLALELLRSRETSIDKLIISKRHEPLTVWIQSVSYQSHNPSRRMLEGWNIDMSNVRIRLNVHRPEQHIQSDPISVGRVGTWCFDSSQAKHLTLLPDSEVSFDVVAYNRRSVYGVVYNVSINSLIQKLWDSAPCATSYVQCLEHIGEDFSIFIYLQVLANPEAHQALVELEILHWTDVLTQTKPPRLPLPARRPRSLWRLPVEEMADDFRGGSMDRRDDLRNRPRGRTVTAVNEEITYHWPRLPLQTRRI